MHTSVFNCIYLVKLVKSNVNFSIVTFLNQNMCRISIVSVCSVFFLLFALDSLKSLHKTHFQFSFCFTMACGLFNGCEVIRDHFHTPHQECG